MQSLEQEYKKQLETLKLRVDNNKRLKENLAVDEGILKEKEKENKELSQKI